MIRTLLAFPALLSLALPFFPASPTAPAAAAPAGPGSVLAMHRDLFAALDRGDADVARDFVASDRKGPGGLTTCFLVDRSGRPLRSVDATSTRELLARLAADAKAAGAGFQTKITFESADCPSGDLSYAVLEFERTRIVDEKPETRHYRGTSLVRMEGSKWKLTHWHVSEARAAE